MSFRNPPKRGRAEMQAEAEAALAAFRTQGGAIKQMPAMVPTQFVCTTCGHVATIGLRPDQRPRCPKCRTLAPS